MMWWLIGLLVAAPIAWFLIKVFAATMVPIDVSGKIYLRQAIRKQGINDHLINEQCIIELVNQAKCMANFLSAAERQKYLIEHFVEQLDGTAVLVACHMEGGFGDSPANDNPVYRTLVKYRVVE